MNKRSGWKENVYKQEAQHMQDSVNKKGYTIDFVFPSTKNKS